MKNIPLWAQIHSWGGDETFKNQSETMRTWKESSETAKRAKIAEMVDFQSRQPSCRTFFKVIGETSKRANN